MWQTCSYLNSHLIKSDWKLGSLVPLVTFLRAQETPVASGHHTDGTDIEQFYHCRKFYWMLILDNPSTLRMRTLSPSLSQTETECPRCQAPWNPPRRSRPGHRPITNPLPGGWAIAGPLSRTLSGTKTLACVVHLPRKEKRG